ncbi:MAG: SDR family oxidoreductase [Candidatus Nanopelagicaceae bacterium]|nr:SDR family oxidoreductase [Candidatus Nanopelagicaceae bacterium]
MKQLEGRRALITGSLRGIGFGIAQVFAREGAEIILHGLGDAESIAAAKTEILNSGAKRVDVFTHDLRDPKAVEQLVQEALNSGAVDILVNNAGIQHTAPTSEMPSEKWDEIIAINLSSAFHTMRAALPKMAERGFGRVINIASVHGLVASVSKAPYVAAKHGLVGLTKVVALEYANSGSRESGGVTVNAICPGWVETALIESQIQARADKFGGNRDQGIADLLSEKQPSKRLSAPTDIGEVALWLCSKSAHNVTGTSIPVDGGWTAQ